MSHDDSNKVNKAQLRVPGKPSEMRLHMILRFTGIAGSTGPVIGPIYSTACMPGVLSRSERVGCEIYPWQEEW